MGTATRRRQQQQWQMQHSRRRSGECRVCGKQHRQLGSLTGWRLQWAVAVRVQQQQQLVCPPPEQLLSQPLLSD